MKCSAITVTLQGRAEWGWTTTEFTVMFGIGCDSYQRTVSSGVGCEMYSINCEVSNGVRQLLFLHWGVKWGAKSAVFTVRSGIGCNNIVCKVRSELGCDSFFIYIEVWNR